MPDVDVIRPMTGSAAAAVLLMLFEEDEAAQILSRLEPEEVRQLGYAMYDVADVEVGEVNSALDQFVNKARGRTTIGYGATNHIRGAMHKALGPVSVEALDELEQIFNAGPGPGRQSQTTTKRGGTSEAAAIMNNIRKDHEVRIIKALNKRDRVVAQSIEDEMFVFENLLELADKDLGTLMRGVDTALLVVALKGSSDTLRVKILGCMSQRAAQSIQDEMDERGPMRLAEVLEAQKAIIAEARRLSDEGTIMLGGRGDDYV